MVSVFMVGPLMVFLLIVAPLWLFLHYRSKRNFNDALSHEDYEQLHQLTDKARQLQTRVETLERILDVETPNWRSRYE
ncbi:MULTISPECIES: envelope stress response membrane protein PspB [Vibrio]|uniref:Envelope stress response membrane protein PspB n=2 Tax=Vibrio TaxID=662 RepID=A0A7X4LNE8_9VIBR|nr:MULTISPECIES: envelope stress response membrane protein PspB [Vibrio]MBF9000737.1 envelope stress response membrane protein PspB [Vibrio nitrifigilis]MZI95177.1 envelope stress response membrane protein PspB [Vibrio eleionomae]